VGIFNGRRKNPKSLQDFLLQQYGRTFEKLGNIGMGSIF
jgi:hypothetical protein